MKKVEIDDIQNVIEKQKDFLKGGSIRDISFRIAQLKLLKKIIKDNEKSLLKALELDLNKSETEGFISEIGMVYGEINYLIKNLKSLSKPKKVKTSIMNFKSKSYIYKEGYGRVLIMSPWNYPVNLALIPLAGSIAAGNCTILKPSEYSINTSNLLEKILADNFDEEYICVIQGDGRVSSKILDNKFDMIFFTGSTNVGRIVMNKASKYLTPTILELGGKSPCIVDETANISLAAKRIVFGKGLNAGQTCVAPDYILVSEKVKNSLIKELIKNIELMYGSDSSSCSYFPTIINTNHFNRVLALIDNKKVVYGGKYDETNRRIGMTILDNVSFEDKVMGEEIFGPILPIISFKDIAQVIDIVNKRPKPLALYYFTTSKENEKEILRDISFGGGCINDTIVHLSEAALPFGGVGESGIGCYHGKETFESFSHSKSVLIKSNLIDMPFRYPPYDKENKILKTAFK